MTEKQKNGFVLTRYLESRMNDDRFATEDDQAKRRYVISGFHLFAMVQIPFIVRNAIQLRLFEFLLDAASVAIVFVALSVLYRAWSARAAFRVITGTLIAVFTYTFFFEEHEVAAVLWFYVLPFVAVYLLGIREGVGWLLIAAVPVLGICFYPAVFPIQPFPSPFVYRLLSSLGLLSAVAVVIESLRADSWRELSIRIERLTKATAELRTLEGLAPICSYCKRIRDDNGYWRRLETFIEKHTTGQISTGLCDNCIQKLPPDEQRKYRERTSTNTDSTPPLETTSYEALKRRFVLRLSVLVIGIILAFSFWTMYRGSQTDVLIQLALLAVFSGATILLWRRPGSAFVYHIMISVGVIMLVRPFWSSDPEPSRILWFLIVPSLSQFLLGHRYGMMWSIAILLVALGIFTDLTPLDGASYTSMCKLYIILTLLVVTVLSRNMEQLRYRYTLALDERNRKLKETYDSIKTIKGMIPVCSSCKAIRNDDGFWTQLDTYMTEHTDLRLSHGVCQSCLKKLFPDVYQSMLEDGEIEEGKVSLDPASPTDET